MDETDITTISPNFVKHNHIFLLAQFNHPPIIFQKQKIYGTFNPENYYSTIYNKQSISQHEKLIAPCTHKTPLPSHSFQTETKSNNDTFTRATCERAFTNDNGDI